MRLIDADALVNNIAARLEYVEQRQKRIARHLHLFMMDGAIAGELRRTEVTIKNAPTIDAVPVVRCKDCKNRGTPYSCPMRQLVMPFQGAGSYEDCTEDDGYCHMGELKDGGAC